MFYCDTLYVIIPYICQGGNAVKKIIETERLILREYTPDDFDYILGEKFVGLERRI